MLATHINEACIDVIIVIPYHWPQYHTIVIICRGLLNAVIKQAQSPHNGRCILTYTYVGKTILQPILRCGRQGHGFISTIIEGLKGVECYKSNSEISDSILPHTHI